MTTNQKFCIKLKITKKTIDLFYILYKRAEKQINLLYDKIQFYGGIDLLTKLIDKNKLIKFFISFLKKLINNYIK
jgi:hypothetical protein